MMGQALSGSQQQITQGRGKLGGDRTALRQARSKRRHDRRNAMGDVKSAK